jgi:hypothetical protein
MSRTSLSHPHRALARGGRRSRSALRPLRARSRRRPLLFPSRSRTCGRHRLAGARPERLPRARDSTVGTGTSAADGPWRRVHDAAPRRHRSGGALGLPEPPERVPARPHGADRVDRHRARRVRALSGGTPRLAGIGFDDTVSAHTGLNLSSDLLGAFYNPYAAVPSLHFGYALLVGVALAVLAERRWVRVLGAVYPVSCSSTSSRRETTSSSTRR